MDFSGVSEGLRRVPCSLRLAAGGLGALQGVLGAFQEITGGSRGLQGFL